MEPVATGTGARNFAPDVATLLSHVTVFTNSYTTLVYGAMGFRRASARSFRRLPPASARAKLSAKKRAEELLPPSFRPSAAEASAGFRPCETVARRQLQTGELHKFLLPLIIPAFLNGSNMYQRQKSW